MNASAHPKILAGSALVLVSLVYSVLGNTAPTPEAVRTGAVALKATDHSVQDKTSIDLMLFMHRADLPVFPLRAEPEG